MNVKIDMTINPISLKIDKVFFLLFVGLYPVIGRQWALARLGLWFMFSRPMAQGAGCQDWDPGMGHKRQQRKKHCL